MLKPAAGAGASGAERVNGPDELEAAIARSGVDHGAEIAVEEFIEGHEGFYDTITHRRRGGEDFVTHYYPNVLEAMRTRWISPQFVATNRIDGEPGYDEVREMGRAVIARPRHRHVGDAHGVVLRAEGAEVLARSAAARPACAAGTSTPPATTSTSTASGRWPSSTARVASAPSRRFAAGIIALRPDRDGTITGYDGVDEIQHRYGEWVIDAHLPPPGTPTQPVEAGYMANAWMRMRHPDYDALREMLDDVGRTVKVHARDLLKRSRPRMAQSSEEVAPSAVARRARCPRSAASSRGGRPRRSTTRIGRRAVPDRRRRRLHVRLPRPRDRVRLMRFGVGCRRICVRAGRESEWWLLALDVPHGSRLEYKLEVTDSFGTTVVEDPLNGRHASHPFGANSVCEATGYAEPLWVVSDPTSRRAGSSRSSWRAPRSVGRRPHRCTSRPGSRPTARPPPAVVVHDGSDYLGYARRRRCSTTDPRWRHPAGGRRPRPPVERLVEYADDPRHAEHLTTSSSRRWRTICRSWRAAGGASSGASFGAVASLSAAWRAPGFFGRLLLQSGSFAGAGTGCRRAPSRSGDRSASSSPRSSTTGAVAERVFVTCGAYESLICENRGLVPVLERTGMAVRSPRPSTATTGRAGATASASPCRGC